MQLCSITSFPPDMNVIDVLCKRQYVLRRKVAEHIKAPLSIYIQRPGTIR